MAAFETERLTVRHWTESRNDLDRVYDIYSRWDVARWLGAAPRAMSVPSEALAAVRRWRDRGAELGDPFGVWAVEVRDSGVVAGTVLLLPLPDSDGSPATDVEVGWHLHPDSWGHGYATEAARAAVERAFAAGIPEVHAVVAPGNERSVAVCRRLGMTPLGRTGRWYGAEFDAFRLRRP
ncbi:MAG TPA: GNAT family N-acetyltransferase [Micromonosporaceae bacterium]